MWLYALPIFLSALLLFMVQPIIAKHILPWFGGTPAVWTTCMVFFQSALLAGYAYAHAVARLLTARKQAALHLLLLAACLAMLPVVPAETWKPLGGQSEIPRILALLLATLGGPYLILAANGPLLQAWFARQFPARSPYRLYALSNVGSLLALLSYPLGLEPVLSVRAQEYLWSGLFVVFAVTCGLCAWRVWRASKGQVPETEPHTSDCESQMSHAQCAEIGRASPAGPAPLIHAQPICGVLTLLLPACACVILLATTNQMTQDLPVVPFLWILPLSLYLLTFILCFDREWWYFRPLWMVLTALGLWGIHTAVREGVELGAGTQIFLYCGGMFACCMVCHGELARLKPAPSRLTGYYLLISAGGALGGLFVTLVAPVIFSGYWEFQGSLVLAGLLLVAVIVLDRRFIRMFGRTGPRWMRAGLASSCLALLAVLAVSFVQLAREDALGVVEVSRNFYGVLQVDESGDFYSDGVIRNLRHGRILHGSQCTDANYRMAPVSYYGPTSGIGVAHAALRRRGLPPTTAPTTAPIVDREADLDEITREAWPDFPPPADWRAGNNLRIGVVGLGAGVLATYGKKGDTIRFYEINADMLRISDKHFTYRRETPAATEVVLGDARLTMERERRAGQRGQFDVIVLDAFSGDSIPLHLLTVEAMDLYLYHLAPGGVLAFHISNRFIRLEGLVRGLADRAGKLSLLIDSDEDDPYLDSTTWVLVTDSQELIDDMWWRGGAADWPDEGAEPIVFTDDYSNLARLLDLRSEWDDLKNQWKEFWNPRAKEDE